MATDLCSRGIHAEILASEGATDFQLAYRRYLSLRSTSKKIYTDNGGAFTGSVDIVIEWSRQDMYMIREAAGRNGTQWVFGALLASHEQGAAEKTMGLLKKGLDKAVHGHILTYWEFLAVLSDCVSIINRANLGYISSGDSHIAVCPQDLLLGHSGHTTGAVYDESTTCEGRISLCQEIT